MDLEELKKARDKALDEYNYDELYSMQPAEVVAMAVTRKRFDVFQRMMVAAFEKAGFRALPPEMYVACAMLTAAASITHLEEIIRVPDAAMPQPVVVPASPEPARDTTPEETKEGN